MKIAKEDNHYKIYCFLGIIRYYFDFRVCDTDGSTIFPVRSPAHSPEYYSSQCFNLYAVVTVNNKELNVINMDMRHAIVISVIEIFSWSYVMPPP